MTAKLVLENIKKKHGCTSYNNESSHKLANKQMRLRDRDKILERTSREPQGN
jgi:hypothetical protein